MFFLQACIEQLLYAVLFTCQYEFEKFQEEPAVFSLNCPNYHEDRYTLRLLQNVTGSTCLLYKKWIKVSSVLSPTQKLQFSVCLWCFLISLGESEYTRELGGPWEGLGLIWKPRLFLLIFLKSGNEQDIPCLLYWWHTLIKRMNLLQRCNLIS